jgi:hypothetical protein
MNRHIYFGDDGEIIGDDGDDYEITKNTKIDNDNDDENSDVDDYVHDTHVNVLEQLIYMFSYYTEPHRLSKYVVGNCDVIGAIGYLIAVHHQISKKHADILLDDDSIRDDEIVTMAECYGYVCKTTKKPHN